MTWLWIVLACYAIGFLVILALHLFALPMVTPPLAFFRAMFWPIWVMTGWPHGTPLRMD